MATVNNRIGGTAVQKKSKNNAIVTFMSSGMEIKLTPQIVKTYLVSGDPQNVTDQEVAMFINLCKYQGLNPWTRECYLIKYGTQPATLVTGKEAFMKRAEKDPNFDGFEAGIIVQSDEGISYRPGAVLAPGESVLGGWAEVFRKDRSRGYRIEISFEEYAGRKKDGSLNGQWSSKPATMIRKTALVQALREAFPTNLGGMYAAEERGVEEPEEAPIDPLREIVEAEVNEVPAAAPASSAADALFGEQEEF